MHVNMRHGTVMSLRGTASGRLFAAYLPRELVLAALAAERADGPHARRPRRSAVRGDRCRASGASSSRCAATG